MYRPYAYLLTALLCCACIYTFEAQTGDVQKNIVIDGDIIVGDTTRIDVRYLQNMDSGKSPWNEERPKGNCWIENDRGVKTYKLYSKDGNSFVFDTGALPAGDRYRVVFHDNGSDRYYFSSFLPVATAPHIDRIYYVLSEDKCVFHTNLTARGGCRYYRWDYSQTWEYTADFAPIVYFNTDSESVEYINGDHSSSYDTFYCWDQSSGAVEYSVGESESIGSDSIRSLEITAIDRSSKLLSQVYRLELEARGMSAEAYEYMNNLKKMSSISGSLFSPNPSDLPGNIRCQEDSTERVYGYVNVCTVSRDTLYVTSDQVYKTPYLNSLLFFPEFNNLYTPTVAYDGGLRPVFRNDMTGDVQWAAFRCVDCIGYGGHDRRPEGWPTDHRYRSRESEQTLEQ